MNNRFAVFLLIPVILLSLSSPIQGAVEWDVKQTLKLERPPLDVAVSSDGKYVFVLTDQRSILIYSVAGKLEDVISVDSQVDGIKVGPWKDVLILSSRKNKTVQILLLDFIQDIDISNSPFKGPADAPVEIAVFGDFQ
jgi:hypothetical protein